MREITDFQVVITEGEEGTETAMAGERTLNIVCHGHSVPSGYFATPIVDTFHAYPHLLIMD
ncbi:hypothetical protein NST99_08380 [Paenibacillus sp. FSL L8-0470]|uniref:hypothetical protein n=1 Tax=Paenibacillus sp. FSL L8-0470 TaxID=2954688 RepID=UPI0030F92A3D